MGGRPVARVTDNHDCPDTTGGTPHVGGPILTGGSPGVLIDGEPIAVEGSVAACCGAADEISGGDSKVRVGGQNIVGMGDSTDHGGEIVSGYDGVRIASDGPIPPYDLLSAAKAAGAAFIYPPGSVAAFLAALGSASIGGLVRPLWSEKGIKREWALTVTGQELLDNLPAGIKFKSFSPKDWNKARDAYYSSRERTIEISKELTSKQAAVKAARLAKIAGKLQGGGAEAPLPLTSPPPAALAVLEVEATHAMLDVWEEMRQPQLPVDLAPAAALRAADPQAFNDGLVAQSEKLHGVETKPQTEEPVTDSASSWLPWVLPVLPFLRRKRRTKSGQANWSAEGIREEWAKLPAGKDVLGKLPASTAFKGYVKEPDDPRVGYYSRHEDAIYIPSSYSSREAAPAAAHQAHHAYQVRQQERPSSSPLDLLDMEAEATIRGFQVWEQMEEPPLPYDFASPSARRRDDPTAFKDRHRAMYARRYGLVR